MSVSQRMLCHSMFVWTTLTWGHSKTQFFKLFGFYTVKKCYTTSFSVIKRIWNLSNTFFMRQKLSPHWINSNFTLSSLFVHLLQFFLHVNPILTSIRSSIPQRICTKCVFTIYTFRPFMYRIKCKIYSVTKYLIMIYFTQNESMYLTDKPSLKSLWANLKSTIHINHSVCGCWCVCKSAVGYKYGSLIYQKHISINALPIFKSNWNETIFIYP